MKKLLIFGGTSEEHDLLKVLAPLQLDITLCVASAYGQTLALSDAPNVSVHTGRLDAGQIKELILREGFFSVIDATHPYAVDVTKNIKTAAFESRIKYLRLLRGKSDLRHAVLVSSIQEAAEKLNETSGNVLLTTGSKDIAAYTNIINYRERLYPRVLPAIESIEACLTHGFPANHIIAMHGPFSKELNLAIMRQFDIKTLVTKDGGAQGGFPEKLEAASVLGAEVIVIRRPDEDGLTLSEVLAELTKLPEED